QILCLHGYRQNKDLFKQKTGSFRKLLKSLAEFDFVDSPHTVDPIAQTENDERSWWFTSLDRTYVSKTPSDYDKGFDESLASLQSYVKENGPFDGLMGFSQGAAFAAIICSLCQLGKFCADFKFVILVAGFKSLCSPHSNYYNVTLDIPSLHVIGDTDNVISKERSLELLEIFKSPDVSRHPGGHYVPASKDYKQTYTDFISKFIAK
ncbi:hypothetical protein AAG570_002409, partial [Ranatra chinensis]